jgi:serine/threonine-protein kinase
MSVPAVDTLTLLQSALAGRYQVEREVARGGMAIVFLARDLKHERPVAVKVLRPELASALGADRFEREIRIAAGLRHPGILPVYDSGADGELLYYVMPFVEGESLRDLLRRTKQLPLDEAIRIASEVADALGYAHGHGIVHRDIKPENILFEGGHAVVADFGIATAVEAVSQGRLTTSGIVVGTPAYMSPEQAGGESVLDGRSDIYSLGCVLYEMLAGEPPFTGPTAQAVLAKHATERPASLRIVRATIPPWLQGTVNVALAKVPADRFVTASKFAEALQRARRPRPHRWRVVLAAVAVAIVALIVGRELLSPRPVLDRRKVVGFPLITLGIEQPTRDLGWLVALGLGSQLERAEPLIWRDGWQWLEERERADPRRITARKANAIARTQRARFRLGGSILGSGDSATVVLQLYDVEADSLVVQQSVAGLSDVPTLIDLGARAVAALLPRLVEPGRQIDLAPLEGRDLSAVALSMYGEREYRLTHFAPALDLYQRAVAQDSGLAMAALKGAQAASWLHQLEPAAQLIEVARAGEKALPTRYRYMVRGLHAYLSGRADTAVRWLRGAIEEDPDWAEGHTALGEVFYHLLPRVREPLDSLAEMAFTSAVTLDSAFFPPYVHLTEIAARRGDLARGRALFNRLRAQDPAESLQGRLGLMLECVDRGPRRTNWKERIDSTAALVLGAAKSLAAGGAQFGCAEAGFRAVLGSDDVGLRWGAVLGLQGLLLSQGRVDEVRSLVDSVVAESPPAMTLYIVDALADSRFRTEAEAVVRSMRQTFGEHYERLPTVQSRWFLGVWHGQRGDAVEVGRLAEGVSAEARLTGDPRMLLFAEALRAHHVLAQGDTARAIELFARLQPRARSDSISWTMGEPLTVERLVLARLLLARRRYPEALQVASTFDSPGPISHLPYVGASLAVRYAAATASGASPLSEHLRRRLVDLGRADLVDQVDRELRKDGGS